MIKETYSILIFTFFFLGVSIFCFGQTTITLQPDSSEGKDALVWSLNPNSNYGSTGEFTIYAWTNSNVPAVRRCFVDFDLSSIPSGATITNAVLTLYNDSNYHNPHSQLSGSNELIVQRIVDPWEEHVMTWNTQPNSTTLNQIIVPPNTSDHQVYEINVTNLVQDMVINSGSSFGFSLRLDTEQYYRKVVFASSDFTDSTVHPKLIITYTFSPGINEHINAIVDISTHPNPFSEFVTVDFAADQNLFPLTIKLTNALGQTVRESTSMLNEYILERNDLPPGLYSLNIYSKGSIIGAKKIVAE